MNLLKKISRSSYIIFLLFFVLHLALLNVNRAEWGDSYRILRASEYIRDFTYPADEKRPPLFSAFLAARPLQNLDPIFWGRLFMFGVSAISFYLFYKISHLVFGEHSRASWLSLVLFALNPTLLYWSLRIYADLFFTMWVLLGFYFVLRRKGAPSIRHSVTLALIGAAAVLTRFEGYILAGALGLSVLSDSVPLWPPQKPRIIKAFLYGLFLGCLLLPYWIWRNPFDSSYFSETSEMAYDLKMVAVYGVSLVYIFGFTSAGAFLLENLQQIAKFLQTNISLAAFLFLELLLILLWPAAIPRLFVPIIPFLVLGAAYSINKAFDSSTQVSLTRRVLPLSVVLTFLYPLLQRKFALQFLVPSYKGLVVIIAINLVSLFFMYKKNFAGFLASITLSMFVWSLAVIWLHRDIYYTVQKASSYVVQNLSGVVAYNDVSSVSPWYLNYSPQAGSSSGVSGVYFDYGSGSQLDETYLAKKDYDYLLITNEHNPDLNIDFDARDHLDVIASYERVVNGKPFFSKVVRIEN